MKERRRGMREEGRRGREMKEMRGGGGEKEDKVGEEGRNSFFF